MFGTDYPKLNELDLALSRNENKNYFNKNNNDIMIPIYPQMNNTNISIQTKLNLNRNENYYLKSSNNNNINNYKTKRKIYMPKLKIDNNYSYNYNFYIKNSFSHSNMPIDFKNNSNIKNETTLFYSKINSLPTKKTYMDNSPEKIKRNRCMNYAIKLLPKKPKNVCILSPKVLHNLHNDSLNNNCDNYEFNGEKFLNKNTKNVKILPPPKITKTTSHHKYSLSCEQKKLKIFKGQIKLKEIAHGIKSNMRTKLIQDKDNYIYVVDKSKKINSESEKDSFDEDKENNKKENKNKNEFIDNFYEKLKKRYDYKNKCNMMITKINNEYSLKTFNSKIGEESLNIYDKLFKILKSKYKKNKNKYKNQ